MIATSRLWLLYTIILTITACSTPQAALDQARNTSALTASLAAEQREFERVQKAVAANRIETIRRQNLAIEKFESRARFDDRVAKVSGLHDDSSFFKSLKELSDTRAQDELDLASKLNSFDDSLEGTVIPIPESARAMDAFEKSLLPLGDELSPAARLSGAASFAAAVKKGVEATREKIRNAEAETPKSVAVQGSPVLEMK